MDTTATLQFEAMAVTSHSDWKECSNLSIQVTKKEIFIGSQYKIKWKNVEDVQIFDADHYDLIGFSLSCLINNNKTTKTEEDGDEQEHRTFEVFGPVPPCGARDGVSAWHDFQRTLTHWYENARTKRTQKHERREEERPHRPSHNENTAASLSNSRRRRTDSKRTNSKYDRFLLKNKDTMERNAMDWTDSEDEHPSQGTTAMHSRGCGSGSSRFNGNWQTEERDTPHRRAMIQHM